MCDKNGISRGVGGGPFCELILENPEGMGIIGKIPSMGGGYGYFLELHNVLYTSTRKNTFGLVTLQSFSISGVTSAEIM